MSASGGGGVHHIALDCSNIFDAVTKLRVNGVPFVPVSPNYYDDIIARLDIDSALKGLGLSNTVEQDLHGQLIDTAIINDLKSVSLNASKPLALAHVLTERVESEILAK